MIDETGERWRNLFAEASMESDPARRLELNLEIDRLLKQKEDRLRIATEQSLISSASSHEFL